MKPVHDLDKIQVIRSWVGSGTIDIFGLPFAGKDTQGNYLAKLLGAPLIGSGDILRSSQNNDVKEIIGKGKLAPTEQFLEIVLPYLAKTEFAGKPLILSSVGRWFGEHTGVMNAAAEAGHTFKAVVFLNLTEQDIHNRWEAAHSIGDRGKREDDAHGVLDVRLEEFRNKTMPVIDFYREQGLLIEVDGGKPPEEVHKEIVDKLYEKSLL